MAPAQAGSPPSLLLQQAPTSITDMDMQSHGLIIGEESQSRDASLDISRGVPMNLSTKHALSSSQAHPSRDGPHHKQPRKNLSISRFQPASNQARFEGPETQNTGVTVGSSMAMSDNNSMIEVGDRSMDGEGGDEIELSNGARIMPNRHSSLSAITSQKHAPISGLDKASSLSVATVRQSTLAHDADSALGGGLDSASASAVSSPYRGNLSPSGTPDGEGGAKGAVGGFSSSGPSGNSESLRRPVKQNPSRLSLMAGPRQGSIDGRETSAFYSRQLGQSTQLATLQFQKTVESLMMQDNDVYKKVQASMRGISSLAKETSNLEVGRDATGATCINQYVVVKTLGRGAFGKVKLCLNTIDGQMYAVKMVNRSFIVRQLQKPSKGLRRRVQRNPSEPRVSSTAGVPPNSSSMNAISTSGPSAILDKNLQMVAKDAARAVSMDSLSVASSRPSIDEVSSPMNSVMREIAVLKKLDHPNVVKLHEVIDPPGASYMMLVMEYMERGSVLETKGQSGFNRFPERIAQDYFRQTCAGLDYLHYNQVVHGDLKPENLLVTAAGQLKIGDFGSARMMSDSSTSSKVSSTPAFQPPEALKGSGTEEDPISADIWALGVCLYCFVYGRLPFFGSCLLDMSNAIRNEEVKYHLDIRASPELVDLFQRMLCKDPTKRIDLPGVMSHPWVTEHGRLPLPSLRTLLSPPKVIEVSNNEAQSAIDRSSLVNMLRARLKEKTFAPGEFLFKEGEDAHCVFMIMAGVVEITTKLAPNDAATEAIDELEDQSFSVDLDESFTLDCANVPAGLDVKDGKLHIDRQKAQDLKARMKGLLMGKATDYVTEVKGPGQVIGEVGSDQNVVIKHSHSARARDTVVVVKLTEEAFMKAVMQQFEGNDKEENDPMLYSTRNVVEDGDSGGIGGMGTQLETIHDDGACDL